MSTDFRLPSISSPTLPGQIQQMQSYLYQLVSQLEFAFDALEKSIPATTVQAQTAGSSSDPSEIQTQTIFNSIKPLIIRSTDIIDAYYKKMNEWMKSEYVALSDYKTFSSTTNNTLKELEDTVDPLADHINAGLLYRNENGNAVYGLEIGRWIENDGVKTFEKYARFTAERTSFYDSDENEVVWISGGKVYYAGYNWVDLGLSDSVSASAYQCGRAADTGCHYRVCPGDNHVYVAFNCAFEYNGSPVQINVDSIPAAYCPQRDTRSLCAVSSGSIARVLVDSAGNVFVDQILGLASTDESTTLAVEWIDGYVDYWV